MIILLILIALSILYISQINFRKIYLAFKMPGPFPLPFIGSAHLFINKKPPEIWTLSEKIYRTYGDVYSFWLGPELACILSDPKDIEVILCCSKFIGKAKEYDYVKPWLNGLLLSTGSKWLKRRKILTPAFHFKILEQYIEIFNRQSYVFVETLSKYDKSEKVELFPMIGLCTLDIIGEAAMGVELKTQQNTNSDYVHAVHTMNHVIHLRMFDLVYRPNFIFRFTNLYKQQMSALKTLHGFTDKIIKKRRQKLVEQNNEADAISKEGSRDKGTFLDILLRATIDGEQLSDLDIREEVDAFMFEGHDTTAPCLIFCFYNIAKYAEVQRKCFQEIRDTLGDDCTKPASFNDLNNLKYLDLVIKETLRLYPSVPFLRRVMSEETIIGKYTFPKGTAIGISPVLLRHNAKVFPNPQEFRPERFLEENCSDNKFLFAYIPFSAGPRNCIGQKFAVISKVLRHFEASLDEDSMETPTLIGEVVTAPAKKLHFHFKPRLY